MRHALSIATLLAALVVVGNGVAANHAPTLNGTVGPEDTITLTKAGHHVGVLKAGAYTVVINDVANDHNFHLTGPGVSKTTSVGGTGRVTWHVTLKKGTYHYVCDPHANFMKGSFTVS